jgi:hypothetical protein
MSSEINILYIFCDLGLIVSEVPLLTDTLLCNFWPALENSEYKVTVRFAKRANLYHLHQFLGARQRDCPQDTIQALDVVLRESPSLKYDIIALVPLLSYVFTAYFVLTCSPYIWLSKLYSYVTVSRSFFSTTFGRRDIGDGLECWRGYYQSLRPTQMGLSLNIGAYYFKNLLLGTNSTIIILLSMRPCQGRLDLLCIVLYKSTNHVCVYYVIWYLGCPNFLEFFKHKLSHQMEKNTVHKY